jgi:hypothetical protein
VGVGVVTNGLPGLVFGAGSVWVVGQFEFPEWGRADVRGQADPRLNCAYGGRPSRQAVFSMADTIPARFSYLTPDRNERASPRKFVQEHFRGT